MKHFPAIEYRHRRLLARLLAAALVLLMPIGISGCEKAEEREFFAMDAYMRIRVYGAPDGALDEAADEIEALSALLSATDEKSEIYALNHAEGKAMTVSPDAFDIIERGLELSREFGGCFELSLRPVSRAWGFTEDENRVPPESELRELLKLVGDERIVTDRAARTVALPAGRATVRAALSVTMRSSPTSFSNSRSSLSGGTRFSSSVKPHARETGLKLSSKQPPNSRESSSPRSIISNASGETVIALPSAWFSA